MPDGKTHLKYWKRGLMPMVIASIFFSATMKSFYPMLFIVGYFLGLFLDPDLDQMSITAAEGRMTRTFGIFGAIFVGYFLPYGYLFKHRGASHWPIWGTFTRWVYVMLPFMGMWVYYGDYNKFWIFLSPYFIWIFTGNMISDVIHIVLDWFSERRRMWQSM